MSRVTTRERPRLERGERERARAKARQSEVEYRGRGVDDFEEGLVHVWRF